MSNEMIGGVGTMLLINAIISETALQWIDAPPKLFLSLSVSFSVADSKSSTYRK